MMAMYERVEAITDLARLREAIPGYLRAGVLRRVDLPDGRIHFVEVVTDLVYATIDARGRLVTGAGGQPGEDGDPDPSRGE